MPELEIEHSAIYIPQLIEFARANEALGDPVTRRDYFEHLTEDGFIELTQRIASVVRTGNSEALQSYDGFTVKALELEPPDHTDKEELLRETWRTAQVFLKDRELSDDDALTLAALTAAGGVIYTHPFYDGSGRTSRVLSYLMVRGNENVDALGTIVEESSSSEMWMTDPHDQLTEAFKAFSFQGWKPDSMLWSDSTGDIKNVADDVEVTLKNSRYGMLAVAKYIEQHQEVMSSVVKPHLTVQDGKTVLDGDAFVRALLMDEQSGLNNAHELLSFMKEFRKEHVHAFLRSMRSSKRLPSFYAQSMTEPLPEGMARYMPQYEALRKRYAAEFGKRAVDGLITPSDEALVIHRASSKVFHAEQESK